MALFFTKAKRAKSQSRTNRPVKRSAQSAETLHRLGCKVCPLDKADLCNPKMKPSGAKHPLILFMGEAPGANEDKKGKPFVGKAGQFLRSQIKEDFEEEIGFTNVVQCRPPDNRTPEWIETQCCYPRNLEQIQKLKPKFLVGLGGIAFNWGTGVSQGEMKNLRGRLFAIRIGDHDCWFYSTWHPSFILRQAQDNRDPLMTRMGHCFRMDLKYIFDIADDYPEAKVDSPEEAKSNIQCFNSKDATEKEFNKLVELIEKARLSGLVAIDLETDGLYPYVKNPKVLTIALSFGEKDTFSFDLDHPKSKWTSKQRDKLYSEVGFLLADKDCVKLAHNAPFELEWLIEYYWPRLAHASKWEDTMVQAFILKEVTGEKRRNQEEKTKYQGLGFLCKQHFGIDIKKLSDVNHKDMASVPIEKLLPYNGMDAKYALKLFHWQKWLLEKDGTLGAYEQHLVRLPTVSLMSHFGLPVDQKIVRKYQSELQEEIDEIKANIEELTVVKKYVKDKGVFNPASSRDCLSIFKDYLKTPEIKVPHKHGDGFSYSVNENVLKNVEHPLAGNLLTFRNKTKLKSTYVDVLAEGEPKTTLFPDLLIHPNYNTTFAETSRLSADHPSVHNFPKRKDAWVRAQIAVPPGYKLVAIDYGQIEGCTAAMCSLDKTLIEALWERYDIHMEWAQKIAHEYPTAVGGKKFIKDADVMKKFRAKVKNKYVFPSIFGATEMSVAGYMDMPLDVIEDLMDDFWNTFSGIKEWQDKTVKRYYKTGYVDSLVGKRRRYPLTRNEVINHPIQNSAAEITVDSMNRISKKVIAMDDKEWHKHPRLNVHDDLTFVVPDKNSILEDSIDFLIGEMLSCPFEWAKCVPISCEVSIGDNWHQLEEIGKFYSDVDL